MKIYFIIFLLLILFFIIYITHIKKKVKRPSKSNLKILHLVLHSHNDYYIDMYNLTRNYYHSSKNVKTIYYSFSPNLKSDYLIKDDILYIKGKETYLPGILDKTVKALKYFEKELNKYDYIVRSNDSTIINFDKLEKLLINDPIDYGGGMILKLGWLDPKSGIYNKKYWGCKYASGTSIIFSRDTLKKLLKNDNKINKDVIDDVSIGLWVKKVSPKIQPKSFQKYFTVVENLNKLKDKDIIFYRNRTEDRSIDIQNMKKIIGILKS
jgi:hypothetical protein